MKGARRRGRRVPGARDQRESAFSSILAELLARVPGARSAALVDHDGETVDYAGVGDPYQMRVIAAHFRIVLDEAKAQAALAWTRSVIVRAARASFAIHGLPDGYALVVRLARGGGFRGMRRAVPVCARQLAQEAGWPLLPAEWYPVDVLVDERQTPRALRVGPRRDAGRRDAGPGAVETADPELEVPVVVLGRFRASQPERERAWRVRIDSGAEFTLVRESGGCWYIDEPLVP